MSKKFSSPNEAGPEPPRSLAILIASAPDQPNFGHGIALAQTALDRGVDVYLYCIDDAVAGLDHPRLQLLKSKGLRLFACAYAAQKRRLPIGDLATFAGLTLLGDLIAQTDRFVSLN